MINIKPILTEKTLSLSKQGFYTFRVAKNLTKTQIKRVLKNVYSVDVIDIKTSNYKQSVRKNMYGKLVTNRGFKKAIVRLKDKQEIKLFNQK